LRLSENNPLCRLFHYLAKCIFLFAGSVSVFGGNATSAVISGLNADTAYNVYVAGLTLDEELPKVGPVIAKTCK
jgi:hypothetical protein